MLRCPGAIDAAKLLLYYYKANVNAQDLQRRTPLFISVEKHDLKMVNLFLQNKADVDLPAEHGQTSLMEAALNMDYEIMKALIANGANVNKEDRDNKTALMIAASTGNFKNVKLLLDNKADPNIFKQKHPVTLVRRQTALMEVSSSGNIQGNTQITKTCSAQKQM